MAITHEHLAGPDVDFDLVINRAVKEGLIASEGECQRIQAENGEVIALKLRVPGAFTVLDNELEGLSLYYTDGTPRRSDGSPEVTDKHIFSRASVQGSMITPESTPLLYKLRTLSLLDQPLVGAAIGKNIYKTGRIFGFQSANHIDKGPFDPLAFVVRGPSESAVGWTNIGGTENEKDGTRVDSGPDEVLVFNGKVPHGGGASPTQRGRPGTIASLAPHFYLPDEASPQQQ